MRAGDVLDGPSLGLVLVSHDLSASAFVEHLARRRASLLSERCVRLLVLAIVGRDGAIRPAWRRPIEDVLRPSADAPYGGICNASLADVAAGRPAASADWADGDGRSVEAALLDALRIVALPSFVLVDFTGTAVRALESAAFAPARFGACAVTIGDDAAGEGSHGEASTGWLCTRTLPSTVATPEAVLDAVLGCWSGWPPALEPAPERAEPSASVPSAAALERCLVCWSSPEEPLVCTGCGAVCFCDAECQLIELQSEGGLPHAACCAALRGHRAAAADAHVSLPGAPGWLTAATARGGPTGLCELLEAFGQHRTARGYAGVLCSCEPHPTAEAGTETAMLEARAAQAEPAPGISATRLRWPTSCEPPSPGAPLTLWAQLYAASGTRVDSPVGLLLDFPMTLYHVIHHWSGLFGGGSPPAELIVDCLGASDECELRLAHSYALLADLLPCTRLLVRMVGPQLSADAMREAVVREASAAEVASAAASAAPAAASAPSAASAGAAGGGSAETPCTLCYEGRTGGRVTLAYHRALYHDLCAKSDGGLGALGRRPHLAIAHNAGVSEYDSWQPTLSLLLEQRTPLYFTSYADVEVLAAASALRELHGPPRSKAAPDAPYTLTTERNPFRQPLDSSRRVGGGAVGVPWVSNALLTAVLPAV